MESYLRVEGNKHSVCSSSSFMPSPKENPLLLSPCLFPSTLSNHSETGRKYFAEVFSHALSLSFFSCQLAKLTLAAHQDLAEGKRLRRMTAPAESLSHSCSVSAQQQVSFPASQHQTASFLPLATAIARAGNNTQAKTKPEPETSARGVMGDRLWGCCSAASWASDAPHFPDAQSQKYILM